MAELRIRTTRHTIRVAAPPQQIYQLIANADRWPHIFDSVLAVEHIGWGGSGERVRFWGTFGDRRGSWVSAREVNPKRMQLRFRQERAAHPLASLGGVWIVRPKGAGALVALDHYYTVVDDDPVHVRHVDDMIEHNGTSLLAALRRAAELDEPDQGFDEMWSPDGLYVGMPDGVGGVISR
ncbi:aromatase/cyclase [Actinophytocola sp.]|uniref:aromatase/cyclase n=1 Tax=Actinophytocola sp. TaxID=1872138 RepID=UPI003D6B70A4